MLGDGDPGEVEEGDGEHDEGEQPAKGARVGHLGESIWNKSETKKWKWYLQSASLIVKYEDWKWKVEEGDGEEVIESTLQRIMNFT